jgi:hypothetical protein
MTCAKKRVRAELTTPTGEVYHGENTCLSPQPTCPRQPGEGYAKCKAICRQPMHAEIAALVAAHECPNPLQGSHMRIRGIDHVCAECQTLMQELGITWRVEP